ncbi:tetratricopeptide repeat protein [Aquimarina gracilis]|uniref:Tetratricopeptide repeat protein n=1 Tax=Aquimarina gracilis TaxID=874422 RepID=A0ABU5ZQW7_9FLAO|nr:tetratricopeptide repeat protein [Aquimarina gracilis]MEB3344314.1 tetratricopeptide repeat protein [Aquimarina gracilis]
MKKLLFLIIYILVPLSITSAQDRINNDRSLYNQKIIAVEDSVAKYKSLSRKAYRAGDLKAFKDYSDIVLVIAEANHLEETRIRTLVNIAIYYQQTDQYEQSLDTYLQAEELALTLPEDSYVKILIAVNLGNLHIAIGNDEMAIRTMKNVIELAKNQDDPVPFYNVAYSVLGTAYLHQKKFQNALKYMELSKDLAIKMDRNDNLIRAMINISECYIKLNRYEDAIENSTQTLGLITAKESIESKALTQLTIANAFIGLKKPSRALAPLKEAKEIAIAGNFLKIKMDSHDHLSKVYESLNDLKNSLKEQKAYTETRGKYLKTLSKAQRLKLEKESEIKSDIISQQKESILFLSKEKRASIFAGVVLIIVLIVSSVVYYKRRQKLAQESLQLQGDKLLLQNENEALKDKLNALAVKIQKQQTPEKETTTQPKKSSIPQKDQQRYMELILNYMEKEKPFLNHEIKQSDIADNLNMSVHLFSEILNVCFQKNFNNFINLYRVDTAKKMIKNPKYENYKILAIGYEAGFPSKTSFNRVFKNLVGLTPSEFQKKNSLSTSQ